MRSFSSRTFIFFHGLGPSARFNKNSHCRTGPSCSARKTRAAIQSVPLLLRPTRNCWTLPRSFLCSLAITSSSTHTASTKSSHLSQGSCKTATTSAPSAISPATTRLTSRAASRRRAHRSETISADSLTSSTQKSRNAWRAHQSSTTTSSCCSPWSKQQTGKICQYLSYCISSTAFRLASFFYPDKVVLACQMADYILSTAEI